MEWLSSIRTAIEYMEEHLTDDISAQDVADRVHLSLFILQSGFSLMTGYGIGEYTRNRRLDQAARDLKETEDKVIEIALRYCYETPESFTKAFSRFHGATPSQVREGAAKKKGKPALALLFDGQYGGLPIDVRLRLRGLRDRRAARGTESDSLSERGATILTKLSHISSLLYCLALGQCERIYCCTNAKSSSAA